MSRGGGPQHWSRLPRGVLRRPWVLLASMAIVTAVAYSVADARPTTYSAEALAVVPAGAGPNDPGAAAEAIKLAVTYAVLIPQDDRVLRYVANRLGMRVGAVERGLSVVHETNTSLLRLRFRHSERAVAVAGARATAQAVTRGVPVSSSVAPGSLARVRLPQRAKVSAVDASSVVPIGILLGFCLGIVVLVAWERADPRTDDVMTLEAAAGCPASELSEASLATLLHRWRSLAGRSPGRVALLPATSSIEPAITAANRLLEAAEDHGIAVSVAPARELSAAGPRALRDLIGRTSEIGGANGDEPANSQDRGGDPPRDPHRTDDGESSALVLVPAGAPGSEAAGEAVAIESDLVVLVASEGTRVVDVRSAVVILDQFGAPPTWALLTPRRMEWARRDFVSWRRGGHEGLDIRR